VSTLPAFQFFFIFFQKNPRHVALPGVFFRIQNGWWTRLFIDPAFCGAQEVKKFHHQSTEKHSGRGHIVMVPPPPRSLCVVGEENLGEWGPKSKLPQDMKGKKKRKKNDPFRSDRESPLLFQTPKNDVYLGGFFQSHFTNKPPKGFLLKLGTIVPLTFTAKNAGWALFKHVEKFFPLPLAKFLLQESMCFPGGLLFFLFEPREEWPNIPNPSLSRMTENSFLPMALNSAQTNFALFMVGPKWLIKPPPPWLKPFIQIPRPHQQAFPSSSPTPVVFFCRCPTFFPCQQTGQFGSPSGNHSSITGFSIHAQHARFLCWGFLAMGKVGRFPPF